MKNNNNTAAETFPFENPYKVGDQVTVCGYSDRQSHTVIKVTATTITIQRDKATLLNGCNSGEPDALEFSPGGFCGHTSGDQRYNIEADPNGAVCIARMKRKKVVRREFNEESGRYEDVSRVAFKTGSSSVIAGSHEFYDFNF